MKCPVCGHRVRPSKKVPDKYLCDTCRKRFPASAVLPDNTDKQNNRTKHSQKTSSKKHRSVTDYSARPDFFDDPLNEPETYHSTAEALRSVRKKQAEASAAETSDAVRQLDISSDSPALSESAMAPVTPVSSESDSKISDEISVSAAESESEIITPPDTEEQTSSAEESSAESKPAIEEESSKDSLSGNDSSKDSAPASPDVNDSNDPAPKKKKRLPFIILALIAIAAIAVFLFFTLKPSGNDSAPATSTKKEDSTKAIYQQGETASYNGIDITLDSYVESEGDDWSVPADGNEFMFVHMTITNHSTTNNDLVISSMASFVNYCDDTKLDYSAAAFTALATTSDQPKLDGTIAPGETLEGYLSLEIPLNWSTVEIQYMDKIWSEDAIHFQIKRQQ